MKLIILIIGILLGFLVNGQTGKMPKKKKYDARVRLMDGNLKSGRVVQHTKDSLFLDSISNAIHYSRIKKIRLMRANQMKIFRNLNPLSGTKTYMVKGEAVKFQEVRNRMTDSSARKTSKVKSDVANAKQKEPPKATGRSQSKKHFTQ